MFDTFWISSDHLSRLHSPLFFASFFRSSRCTCRILRQLGPSSSSQCPVSTEQDNEYRPSSPYVWLVAVVGVVVGDWVPTKSAETWQLTCDGWLGGGFKEFLFSPLLGEDSHFDLYFSNGLKPPTSWDFGSLFSFLKSRRNLSKFATPTFHKYDV